jgi:hypothetical protein
MSLACCLLQNQPRKHSSHPNRSYAGVFVPLLPFLSVVCVGASLQVALTRLEPRSVELLRTLGKRAKRSMLLATEAEFERMICRQQHTLDVRFATSAAHSEHR